MIKNPFDTQRHSLNFQIFQKFLESPELQNTREKFINDVHEEISKKILSLIEDKNPDLLVNFNDLYIQLTSMMKDFDKTIKDIQKKSKKVFESNTLAEDLYKTRDEVKNIKKKIDKFNSVLKSLSRLGDITKETE